MARVSQYDVLVLRMFYCTTARGRTSKHSHTDVQRTLRDTIPPPLMFYIGVERVATHKELLCFLIKLQRRRIYAVVLAIRRARVVEEVAQVTAARCAQYLRTMHAK